jgi:hypothetical protein
MDNTVARDGQLIDRLGGPAKVAELLGINKAGGVQRVHNWRTRGIPPAMKLQRPDLFLIDENGESLLPALALLAATPRADA